jgi:polysaccharide deacetylase 2 family uncharacterized protein YibQ
MAKQAKPRPKTKPKPRIRKPKKAANAGPNAQFMRIAVGLAILVCLVVTAALLAERYLKPSTPAVRPMAKSTTTEVAPAKPEPTHPPAAHRGPLRYKVPDYEAFHQEAVPPPPPITRVKPVTNGIPVAIIIDDVGYDQQMADGFLSLGVPLTFSMLPGGTFNDSIISEAHRHDVEIMLHLPMEPAGYPAVNPGPGALLSDMSPDELIARLNANLQRVPGATGVNNHMGSKLTTSSEQMRQIFTILKKHNLFFIDSRTSKETICRPSAELLQLPFAERDVFIDHEQTPAFIRKQLNLLIARARKQGYAIGIAHPHPVTLKVLTEMLPELKKAVYITHASAVVAFQQS